MKRKFEAKSIRHGGHLRDLPRPHVRQFPTTGEKRKVVVRCHRYDGIGIHYYTSLEEEGNPIWQEKDKAWVTAWDDEKAKGRRFDKRCNSQSIARQFIKKTFLEEFSRETHVLVYDSYVDDFPKVKWFYKGGD